jgi:formate/nitrite transporter FocA (FNT family)
MGAGAVVEHRPAGIGNMIGGTVFVALPFWWVFRNAVEY